MKRAFLFLLFTSMICLTSCDDEPTGCLAVTTDSDANLTQFLGLWYEIASFPLFFNAGCSCTTAEYTLAPNGAGVTVNNNCQLFGAPNGIQGIATQPDPNDFSKLKVQFPTSPSAGDYWILEFASDASYMLVGNPAKDNLYILSRTSTLDQTIYDDLVKIAEDMCFDVSNLQLTDQSNCN